jgi:Asp-tRNA(Asn)/Glu-tRNA(Gln) amidotransferase B subunit
VADPEVARQVGRIYDDAGVEHAKRIAFWLLRPVSDDIEATVNEEAQATEAVRSDGGERSEPGRGGLRPSDTNLVALSQMVGGNKLSSTAAKEVLDTMLKTGESPEKIAETKNLLQVSDEGAIADIVAKVLAENPKAAGDVQNGEMKAIGFLVGQVMKQSQGKANPALATQLIKKQLGI